MKIATRHPVSVSYDNEGHVCIYMHVCLYVCVYACMYVRTGAKEL